MSNKTHTTNSRTFLREFKDLKGKLYSGEVVVIEIPDKKEDKTLEIRVKESERSKAMERSIELIKKYKGKIKIKRNNLWTFDNVFPRLK
jgi:hypothetical protein